ncbi:hypothetical protein [Mycobacteroides abscessus]|uniref:hypothetical protein n=1 Tax=Mycobacteroides abscessus TaxID=36809 RepID=UPI0019CF77D4|nr:hypothetical protein [Mycobacteroides abscessus]MBN7298391.1 hypothetical protein [Mycobacteroides abscessus subsp. abscessus]
MTGGTEAGPATGAVEPVPAAGGGEATGGGTTELAEENPRANAEPGLDAAEAVGFVDESPPLPKAPAGD